MVIYTPSQIREHNTKESCWVIFKNKVYDLTDFARDHPGGSDVLLQFAGTDVTDLLDDETLHVHSDAAYELLDEYYIGDVSSSADSAVTTPTLSVQGFGSGRSSDMDDDDEVATIHDDDDVANGFKHAKEQLYKMQSRRDDEFLDLRKPLFPQLWNATWSKEFYLEQVHRPRFVPHYVPYFSNPWMDVLSRTSWYTVPMIWLPFVAYQIWRSTQAVSSSYGNTAQGFALGVLFWTLLEYSLHRFLFHLDDMLPDHPIALLFHFTLHGIHHHMPMDRLRLVMPPALTVLIGFPVIKLTHLCLSATWAHAFVAGAFFGYVCYDCIHYYLHHAQVIRIHFREMKRYHLAHHYKNYESGYGITSKLWDYVFGTVLTTAEKDALE